MTKDSKDIYEIKNDIIEIMNKAKMNESFVFGDKQTVEKTEPDPNMTSEMGSIKPETAPEAKPEASQANIDDKVKQIRKLSVETLMNLDPTNNQDSYKMIKGIWDSCDKYLLKDNIASKAKEQPENNI